MRKSFKKRSKKILSIFLLLPFIAQTFVTPLFALDEIFPETQVDTSEDILEEGISDPAEIANPGVLEEGVVEEPLFVYEDGVYTVDKVVVNEEYVYPDNKDVRIKFTRVTQEGNLVISRVTLTEEEKELLNTSDDYGWDISSSMGNGTFTYDLTLPNSTERNDVEVKYSEDGNTYESIDEVIVNENVIEIKGLEHFTIFVVVDDGDTNSLNATYNWWGDASGPYNATTNPTGTGNAVSNNVDYKPWYKDAGMTISSDTKPSTPTGLTAKFQNDSQNLENKSTINITAKPNNNNLELQWQPNSIDLVTGYHILATYPDGSINLGSQDSNTNAWLIYNGFGAHGNGKYTYQVRAVNANGTSDYSEQFIIYYDTKIPTATLTSAPDNNSYVNGDFYVAGTAQDNVALKSVFFDVRTEDGSKWISGCKSGTTTLTYSDEKKNAAISCTIDTRNLVNGTKYMLRIHAGDNAGYGNVNSDAIRYFTMDTENPTVTFSGLRHYDYRHPSTPVDTTNTKTNDNTPIVLISASDSLSGMSSVTVNGQTATYDGSTYWIVELTTLPEGAKTLEIVGTDKAGNTTTISQDIFIDTFAPTAIYKHYNNEVLIDETTNPITYVKGINQLSFTADYTDTEPSSGLLQDSFVIFQAQDDGSFRFSADGKKAYCSWRKSPNLVTQLTGSAYSLTDKIQFTNCISSLQDGEYYMTHQVYDNAVRRDIPSIHQYRDVLGLHFVVDSTPPSTPTLESPINGVYINDNTPLMQWADSTDDTSVAGYYYRVYRNCTDISDSSTCSDVYPDPTGLWSTNSEYQAGTTSDGTYYWQVKAVDIAGNESQWSGLEKVVIDTQEPDAPKIESPVNNSYFNSTPILNNWNEVSDSSGVAYYRIEYVYDDGHTFSGGPYRTTTNTSRNHTPNISEQGGVTIRVQAVDNAGNEGNWSDVVHYTYDETNPTVPTNGQPNNSIISINNFDFTWGASTDSSPITYEFQSSMNSAESDGVLTTGLWKSETLSSNIIHSSGAQDGKWYWQVRAKDAAGNYSNWSQVWDVTIDTNAPTVEITSPEDEGLYNTDVTLSGTVTDANPHHYWLQITKDGTNLNIAGITGEQTATVFNTTLTEEGEYYVTFAARDAAGGTSRTGNRSGDINISFTIDKTPPGKPSPISPANNLITRGDVLKSEWSKVDDAHTYIYESYHDENAQNLRWHEEFNTTSKTAYNVSDATFWWRVKAVDLAGNVSGWSDLWKVTVDNTPPTTPTTTLTANNLSVQTNGYTSSYTFTFNLSSSEDTTRYQLKYWNNIQGSQYKEDSPWGLTDIAKAGYMDPFGSYNDKFTQGEGEHYFAFSACDAAGNCSAYSDPFVVTYDKTAPVITLGDYSTDWTNQDIDVTASTNEGTLNTTSYTFTENGTFDFIATDEAGNPTTQTVTITNIDKTIPTINSMDISNGVLTVSSADTISNVKSVEVQINGGTWTPYTSGMNLYELVSNVPGTYTVSVRVTDNANNSTADDISFTIAQVGEVQGATTGPTPRTSQTYYAQTTNTSEIEEENTTDETEMEVETNKEVLGETTCEATYKISGTIYYDKNENGKYDEDEKVVEGIEVKIYNSNKELEKTVTTDEKGHWEATLCPGEYTTQVEGAEDQTVVLGDSDTTLDISVEKPTNWLVIVLIGLAVLILLGVVVSKSKKKEEI